jgi:hypothetical protein
VTAEIESSGSAKERVRQVSGGFIDKLAQVEAHVQSRLIGRVRDLRLEALEQGIVLRGRALTYHVKQLAQHAVMEASGLPIVANEIEVIG